MLRLLVFFYLWGFIVVIPTLIVGAAVETLTSHVAIVAATYVLTPVILMTWTYKYIRTVLGLLEGSGTHV